jgi:hypothetical protein
LDEESKRWTARRKAALVTEIIQPRVKDRTGQGIRFESKLVPHYVRRAASIDAVLPWLYLRGISQAVNIGRNFPRSVEVKFPIL